MHRTCAITLALFSLVAVVLSAGCVEETPAGWVPVVHHVPPVFADLSYEEAKAEAEASGKLLIVDAMASWCCPCKEMDKTTWVDETVVSWVNEHAIAVQVDVDKCQPLAMELKILPPIPITVVYKDGEEFSRVTGKRTPEQLLEWLNKAL